MQSQRDHVQAYQFAVERLARATVAGNTGGGDAPMRRSTLGVTIGIVLAVLGCAGALIYGLISPAPSSAWRNPGAIIVEKDTGTRYLLMGGELHPTANYASALLVAGRSASLQYVPRAQLAGVPIGGAIGIPGAPDEVPSANALLAGTWAICAKPGGGSVLDLDPAGRVAQGPDDERVFVSSSSPSDPGEFLVWHSVKYPLPRQSLLPALGLGNRLPDQVDPAWLDALPTGPAIAPPAVPRLGAQGPSVAGHPAPVGTLYSTTVGGSEEDYLLLPDGLAPISRTEVALFELSGLGNPLPIGTAEIAAAPVSANHALLTALPDFLAGPVFDASDESLCVRQSSPGSPAGSAVVTEQASVVASDQRVVLPAGEGMLVEQPGQARNAAAVYLVTDIGQRYLVDSTAALGALGYAGADAVVMPASVLGLIPSGPNLDVQAAARAVP